LIPENSLLFSGVVEKDFRGHGLYLSKFEDLEGKIIRIQFHTITPLSLSCKKDTYHVTVSLRINLR